MTHHVHELRDDLTKKEEVETMFHKISAAVPTHAGSAVVCRQNCGSACAPGLSGWRRCARMNGGISI